MEERRPIGYRFDEFIEEARNLVSLGKSAAYVHILFADRGIEGSLGVLSDGYTADQRHAWILRILRSVQTDFVVLEFVNKTDPDDRHRFYWKIKHSNDLIQIVSMTLETYQYVNSCLKSFLKFAKRIRTAWIESSFLENADLFLKRALGQQMTVEIAEVFFERKASPALSGKPSKPGPAHEWSVLDKGEIEKRRQFEFEEFGNILYVSRVRLLVMLGNIKYRLSISDEAELYVEAGDLFVIMDFVWKMAEALAGVTEHLTKRLKVSVDRVSVPSMPPIEVKTIELLEVLSLEVKTPAFENWRESVIALFSRPYDPETNLACVPVATEGDYFLSHVLDMELGSAVYLSLAGSEIRISPASSKTESGTVSRLLQFIQKYVDPTISTNLLASA